MNRSLLRYEVAPGRFDEAVAADGSTRPGWHAVDRFLGTAAPDMLIEQRRRADRLLDAEGAGHIVHDLAIERWAQNGVAADDSRPWRLDPIPFVIDDAEFQVLADALRQRMRLLERTLEDLYGQRTLVANGTLAPADLFAAAGFRPGPQRTGPQPSGGTESTGRWLTQVALDVVRCADGSWKVVQDLTDAPVGFGYALMNRSIGSRLIADTLRASGAAPLQSHTNALRMALTAAAPVGSRSPRCVVLTTGPAGSTYVEHSYLAAHLGYHLAEGADLVMREGRLWLRALDGLEPVDVVYRRIGDALLDPLEPNHDGRSPGVPGIVWGAQRRGVALANAYGAALASEPVVRECLSAASMRLLGEPLRLPTLTAGAALASAPVFNVATGVVEPHGVVLRLFAVAGADGIDVMPGAVGRVLRSTDDPSTPTAQLVKDVWVVGGRRDRITFTSSAAPPQVDLRASVPKRAADALYWLGRSAERAEAAARCLRVVNAQLEQDPLLQQLADGSWERGASALLRAAQGGVSKWLAPDAATESFHDVFAATATVVTTHLASVVQEAMSVREFLSTTTGRVLGRLARTHQDLLAGTALVDDLELILLDLAALAGLAMESTVRGPAWRFLDLGRRIERSLVVLGSVEAALGRRGDPLTFQPLAEALLSSNESLVAYRRRYRSDVELHAVVDLLVHDDSNPRGLAFQLDRLREHVVALAWAEGAELVEAASRGAMSPVGRDQRSSPSATRRNDIDAFVLATRGPLLELVDALSRRWFADPVQPTMMRGS